MDELIPWLHQVLNTVEAKAKAATRGPWRVNVDKYGATVDGPDALQDGGDDGTGTGGRRQVMRPLVVIPPDVDYGAVVDVEDAEHIAFHNPERVRQAVAATRRILDLHAHIPGDGINFTIAEQDRAEETIKLLALPYADWPGYQERWRP